MTRRYLVPLGLASLSSDPTGSSAGQTYYNTTSDKIRVYNGTGWEDSGLSAQDLENGSLQSISLSGSGDFTIGTDANLILNPGASGSAYIDSVSPGNEIITVTSLGSGSLQSISLGGAGDFTINSDANLVLNPASGSTVYIDAATAGNEVVVTSALNSAIEAATLQGVQGANGSDGIQGAEGPQGIQGANAGITSVGDNLSVASGELNVDLTSKADASSPTITGTLILDGAGDFTISSDAAIIFEATSVDFAVGIGDFTIDADSNIVLQTTSPNDVYVGSAVAGNEIVTTSALSDAIAGSTLGNTDDLDEGLQNLYYTGARVGQYIADNNLSLQGATGAQGEAGPTDYTMMIMGAY